jgi:hypothetical protein
MSDLKKLCKQVLELDAKATKGPWINKRDGFDVEVSSEDEALILHSVKGHKAIRMGDSDSELIAHYRTTAVKLAKVALRMDIRLRESCVCYRPGEPGYPKPPCPNCALLADVQKIVEYSNSSETLEQEEVKSAKIVEGE